MLVQGFFFFLLSIRHVSAPPPDIVSALNDINQAVAAGRHIVKELTSYVNKEEDRLNKLRQVIQRLNSALEVASTSTEEETTVNPVSAFLLILRLASNWSSELTAVLGAPEIQMNDVDALMAALMEFDSRSMLFLRLKKYADMLPDDNDVQGALDAVIRLQQTYNISSIDIAEGKILSSSSSPRLTDEECLQLGRCSYDLGDYLHAIEWYLIVLDRINEERKNGKYDVGIEAVSHATIYDHLSYAFGRSGRYKEALEAAEKLLLENPASKNGAHSKAFYNTELKRLHGNDPPHTDDESERTEDAGTYVFEELCRQANEWMPPNSNRSCRHSIPHSYFKLGPLKEEVLLEDPPVLLFHDFVTQNEADQIIELAKPKLKRALVRNTGRGKVASFRVAKSVFFEDDLNNLTKRINRRIRMATGLNLEHGEELQVANYGLGGYYAPHYDYWRLTQVELGGGTAFPKIGLVVKPVARSMVFWFNLFHNGDGDLRSLHGACPVLSGNKWVMNKWIRSAGQEFTRPCKLESEHSNPNGEHIGP
ncbi:hypothetical protein Aperf_G00000113092 [Anoplocephala perfoliata]